MTSDAKIGLLLGLVFIFIIAFVINGLPNFHKDRNNNELTTNMVNSQNKRLGIAMKERKAQKVITRIEPVKEQPPKVQIRRTGNQDIRFITPLPNSTSAVKEAVKVKAAAPARPLPAAEKKKIRKVKLNKPTLPKVYVVSEGDNLGAIAKKLYGSEDGNKEINVRKIFEANRRFLKSADEIYPGQKLVIPALSASAPDKSKTVGAFASTMFKKVESIGQRYLSSAGSEAKQSGQYVVREGDSLWQIAAEKLGDGSRYGEIARLNADVLDDEDSLAVGMCLRMPAR